MEFPHIGQNCAYSFCNKLDFLPMKCNLCQKVYCSDHFAYAKHECPSPNSVDVQVPVCPLCSVPVPGKRGEPPDVAVSAHIDNQCTSDPAKERRNKVFVNRCAYRGCKGKELVPLVCGECSLNYCLRHRHASDHRCGGKLVAKRLQAEKAALQRIKAAERQQLNVQPVQNFNDIQGNMTEDEALAHALALSMEESSMASRDAAFAGVLNRQRVGGEQNQRCIIS